jgi:hypothetical protein
MRLVVHAWLPVYPRKWHPDTGEMVHESGWYHVDKSGMLLQQSPCEASIHRFDMEWPDDCTNLNHMLSFEGRTPEGHLTVVDGQPTPNSKTIAQLDAARKSR